MCRWHQQELEDKPRTRWCRVPTGPHRRGMCLQYVWTAMPISGYGEHRRNHKRHLWPRTLVYSERMNALHIKRRVYEPGNNIETKENTKIKWYSLIVLWLRTEFLRCGAQTAKVSKLLSGGMILALLEDLKQTISLIRDWKLESDHLKLSGRAEKVEIYCKTPR